jgi:hypothetical protein
MANNRSTNHSTLFFKQILDLQKAAKNGELSRIKEYVLALRAHKGALEHSVRSNIVSMYLLAEENSHNHIMSELQSVPGIKSEVDAIKASIKNNGNQTKATATKQPCGRSKL